ncbi:aminoglycoside phosphotransferase family protein [Shimia marina]|uniref:Putative phosphotransferase related to Ser/Thr protein kinases n=1 Tax=Shimia marina TaxID=321267 RepID=A0A0P1EMH9_9RHOB|nr:phosphotransferase [Shimia marina]CUH51448.1 putative phosphotransferase related to Ser/Thr protein kinases [Shimia marina]SFD48906.1 hypothetical protein SAMN04488037_101221 [Shimia marina]
MTTRRSETLDAFLVTLGWSDARRTPLAGDASSRRYERLKRPNGDKAILMDAPPNENGSVQPFVQIAEHLITQHLSAPRILGQDIANGMLLIEDLGDALFAREMMRAPDQEAPLYKAATEALIALHKAPLPRDMQIMDATTLAEMITPVFDFYIAAHTPVSPALQEQIKQAFESLFTAQLPPPDVLILRDFHAENLLWLPAREGVARVGLLDFQDALIGHRAYDLVSMLQDARRDVAPSVEAEVKAHFIALPDATEDDFNTAYHLLGAQRNLRILGIFARLCMQMGKAQYVDLIPRVHGHVLHNLRHPALAPVAPLLIEILPDPTPEFLKTLKDKCATHPMP